MLCSLHGKVRWLRITKKPCRRKFTSWACSRSMEFSSKTKMFDFIFFHFQSIIQKYGKTKCLIWYFFISNQSFKRLERQNVWFHIFSFPINHSKVWKDKMFDFIFFHFQSIIQKYGKTKCLISYFFISNQSFKSMERQNVWIDIFSFPINHSPNAYDLANKYRQ
jgi:hypothetical protein